MENDTEMERRISERAFQIWIEEGQPYGRDKEHWAQAEKEIADSLTRKTQTRRLVDGGNGYSPKEE